MNSKNPNQIKEPSLRFPEFKRERERERFLETL
jgi:hypothetical protein